MYPEQLEKVIDFYKKLPGIGEKTALRLAIFSLEMEYDDLKSFSNDILDSKIKLKNCINCGHLTDQEICTICSDKSRNHNLICVLEDYKSVFAFEQSGNFRGVYHVLGGLISPIDDVGPEDINLSSLIKRVNDKKEVELVLALKSSIEGETTTLYLKKILEDKDVDISRLSHGIPMNAEIDYLDVLTLEKAFEDRKKLNG